MSRNGTRELRRSLRERRAAIGADLQIRRSAAVADHATSLPWWDDAASIGLYVGVAGELDVGRIGDRARAIGKTSWAPVLDGERLRFASYDSATEWSPNRFGILEPTGTELADGNDLDLVVVPAVAVDLAGNRIGMGAGFYDRTFAGRTARRSPRLVAAVHDEQIVDAIEPDEWDVPMDAILTPTGVRIVQR